MTLLPYILPLVLLYFIIAALAVTRGTHVLRVILWLVVVSLAWRVAATADILESSGGFSQKLYRALFILLIIFVVTRTFDWSLQKAPLVRHLPPGKGSQFTAIHDILDLALTLRGYGWDWSHGVYIPRETRPASRRAFIFHVIQSAVIHALACHILHQATLSFFPIGLGTLSGGSIFDENLPFYMRYLRSTIISVFTAFSIYAVIQMCYDTCTLFGVLVFGQDRTQWAPVFNDPWWATSLSDFWGRRWHQFFRRTFLIQAGYPLSYLFGRVGHIVGAFFASAMMHYITLLPFNRDLEPWGILLGFGMMAVVVIVEGTFKRLTGRKVEGWAGWVWAMAWLTFLANIVVDIYARSGVFGHLDSPRGVTPGHTFIEGLVANLDYWLHMI